VPNQPIIAAPMPLVMVVVARRDVPVDERTQRVERRLRPHSLSCLSTLDLDLVERHVAGAFDHHLATLGPGDLGGVRQAFPARELAAVSVGVADRARGASRRRARTTRVSAHQGPQNLIEALVEETLLMMRQATHFAMIEPPRETMPGDAVGGEVTYRAARRRAMVK